VSEVICYDPLLSATLNSVVWIYSQTRIVTFMLVYHSEIACEHSSLTLPFTTTYIVVVVVSIIIIIIITCHY